MLKLYNSLSREVEEFKPINPPHVGMYTCGPTVYDFAHIGNFRSYSTADLLVRALNYNNQQVKFIMNITDVGHLVSDDDTGEDKMEKSAKKEGKTAWEVAKFYTDAFLEDYQKLHYTKPQRLAKATDHIQEQIELVRRLEAKGFTYIITDGVYFDTANLSDYGKLSTLDQNTTGVARVEINEEKRNARDFALWKFSPVGDPSASSGQGKRQMEWKSPWGKGFPGWHLECSAMSMKYLGETFDIHTGGVDHISVHHTNEIAQSEAATGKKFVNYWVHTAFMLVAGQKMSKSLGNIYRIYDLEKAGHEPLALRYLYMQTHYRQEMNFTFSALEAAENALKKLYEEVVKWDDPEESVGDAGPEFAEFEKRFREAVNEDLNMPKALAVVWEMVKSDYPSAEKAKVLFKMDEILGFNFKEISFQLKREQGMVPDSIRKMVAERESLRKHHQFNAADHMRAQIEKLGYELEDTKKGARVKKKI